MDSRVALEDLLYDFDDFIDLETFDAERFTKTQAAAKSFARAAIETIKVPAAMLDALEKADQEYQARTEVDEVPVAAPAETETSASDRGLIVTPGQTEAAET